jgi:hypothetical protein
MAEMEKIVEKKIYEEGHKKNYATNGTALGVGIPALVLGGLAFLGQMGKGGGFNLFGGGATPGDAPTAFDAWKKECADAVALTNEIWGSKLSTMQTMAQTREVAVREKFGLYKTQRDLYDVLNERYSQKFNDLDKKVAVLEATRPYQDKLIQCEIDRAFGAAVNYTDKKTCRAIYGVVGLPSTPTVTVLEGANPFGCNPAPARAQG